MAGMSGIYTRWNSRTQRLETVNPDADRQYVAILKEAVISTIITPKQIKNHMGKRSWRALKQLNHAVEKCDVMNAERAAVELGLTAEVIAGLNVLLER